MFISIIVTVGNSTQECIKKLLQYFVKEIVCVIVSKNNDPNLFTFAKNKLSLEQIILAQCSIHIMRPDFHFKGQTTTKFKNSQC